MNLVGLLSFILMVYISRLMLIGMIFGVLILEIVKIFEIKINVLNNFIKKFCGKL